MSEDAPQLTDTQKARNFSAKQFSDYKRTMGESEWQAEQAEFHKNELDSIKAAKKVMQLAQLPEDSPAFGVLPSTKELEDREDKALENYVGRHGLAQNYDGAASAYKLSAERHLYQNKEAYEQAAIEDANAAGHDVNFGGEHYPAQQPEEPKELQHQ
jgi:hypothetical protein